MTNRKNRVHLTAGPVEVRGEYEYVINWDQLGVEFARAKSDDQGVFLYAVAHAFDALGPLDGPMQMAYISEEFGMTDARIVSSFLTKLAEFIGGSDD